MSQTFHIAKNKEFLILRSHITRWVREFFWSHDFLEVETPLIVALPGQEPNLSAMHITIHDEKGKAFQGYLHTSPEYTMKKMLAAGFPNIFSLCKTFRDDESFGDIHNPEFTMIEWYRIQATMFDVMADVEELVASVAKRVREWGVEKGKSEILNYTSTDHFQRIHMRDLWSDVLDINLDNYLEKEKMFELCIQKGYRPDEAESYEELFYRIFLNEIEPHLAGMGNVIIHHYPAPMSALSKLSSKEIGYAERFEVYMNGIEIANAFSELTDATEQLRRLHEEQEERKRLGKDVYAIDMEFVEAVSRMPDSAGIALGIDRLVQVLLGCKNIDDVIVLPLSHIFKT